MALKKLLLTIGITWIVIGGVILSQTSFSLVSNVVANFALGKVAAVFIACGGMVAAASMTVKK